MLTLEMLRPHVAALPTVVRLGLVVLALGGAADVVAHLGAVEHVADGHVHAAAEVTAHQVGFVGMVLILAGVVVDGVRRTPIRHRSDWSGHQRPR